MGNSESLKSQYRRIKGGLGITQPLALGALVKAGPVVDIQLEADSKSGPNPDPMKASRHQIVVEMTADEAEAFAQGILDEVATVRAMWDEKQKAREAQKGA